MASQPPQNSDPQSKPARYLQKKNDEITPKIGARDLYKQYDELPFQPFDKSKLFQEEYINNRVEERMRRSEQVADKMNLDVSEKDKFIYKKSSEPYYFHGKLDSYYQDKTKQKYDKISKQNEGYKNPKIGEDNYYKNYVDNAKPVSLDEIDHEIWNVEQNRLNKQKQYNNDLDKQVCINKKIQQKAEKDYKQEILDNKKYQDDVYNKQQSERNAKKMKEQNDFFNTNKKLIETKNEKKLNEQKVNYDYDNKLNEQVKEQMDYIEAKEYMKQENSKRRYKEALDKQVNQQKAKIKRMQDLERGKF